MKKLSLFIILLLTLFLVPQAKAAVLVTQPTVSSGDSWTVNYNNGQTFEFDMNYSGQWPVLLCKNSASGNVGIWFQSNEVYVKTSGGFIKNLGGISSGSNTHYKVVCNNNDVFVYANRNLVGNATDPSINVPSNNFVNNPRVDFVANGYTQMTNFSIADSEFNVAPTITSLTVPTTTQLQNTPIEISGEFTDTSTSDTHTATIDWGDGNSSSGTITESNGLGTVTGSHSYTRGGDYTIKLTVTDQDGASSRKEAQIHINLSPTIYRIEATNINNTYSGIGYFSDGDSTSWTGTVNYGDGTGQQPLQIDNQNHKFSLNHFYSSNEEFTITVTVVDNYGQSSSPFPAKSDVLVTQPSVSSGDSWTVDYNNGLTFEFDMNYSGQWPVLLCKNSASGSVGIWFQSNEVYVKTSSGFSQLLGGIYAVANQHYKVVCGNDKVAVYYNGGLLGEVTDSSINVPSNNFTNQPRVDFVANGYTQMTNFSIFNTNAAPSISAISDATINEGQSYTENGSFTDTDSTSWTATVNYGDGSGSQPLTLNPDNTFSLSHVYKDNGTYTVAVTITDNQGATGTGNATVTVNNATPTIGSITAPTDPVAVNTSINASGTFSDSGVLDTHTAVWDWGDGTTSNGSVTETNGSGTVSDSHAYASAGVYSVALTVTDNGNESDSSTYQYIVVYNTNAGFVTGSGRITSPVGAYTQDPNLTGNAIFGFVSKYQNGANTPTGNTQFRFIAAGFTFNSTSYDWLVVAGPKGQYKGSGTVNGSGDYGFMLTAIDGDRPGGGGEDKFRLKVWDKTTGDIIYDNQVGSSDTSDPTTVIQNGSIIIHN